MKLRRFVSASRCFKVSRRLYLLGLISQSFEKLGPIYQNLAHQRKKSLLLSRLSAWETKLQTTTSKNAINPIIIIKQSQYMRVGTLIVATIYLQLIQNRYMFRSFTVLQCSHQHCVQPVARAVEVVGYLQQRLLC